MADTQTIKVLSDLEALQDVTVDGSLIITATSSFSAIGVVTGTYGEYSVDDAFHKIDYSVTQFNKNIANAVSSVTTQYNNNRYILNSSLNDSGSALINLTTQIASGTENFSALDVGNVSLDLLLDTNGDGRYRNDLTSYEIFASGSDLYVSIDTVLRQNNNFRLIVVNEKALTQMSTNNGLYIIAGPQGPQGTTGATGATGATGKSYISVAFGGSTSYQVPTVLSNFSLSTSQAPNGFNLIINGYTSNENTNLVVELHKIATGILAGTTTINSTTPTSQTVFMYAPTENNEQYELRYYCTGQSNNFVFIQTAIIEIL